MHFGCHQGKTDEIHKTRKGDLKEQLRDLVGDKELWFHPISRMREVDLMHDVSEWGQVVFDLVHDC